jgi:ATP/maltotriose-dependent transcriptional regulator MalT
MASRAKSDAARPLPVIAAPVPPLRPAPDTPEAHALHEASQLHALCNREPATGFAAASDMLRKISSRRLPREWLPIVRGAVENALTAAEHKLGRLPEAAARATRTAADLRTNTWLHATPEWRSEHDRILAVAARLLAVILDDQGNHADALPWHREAIAIYERRGDRLNQAKQWHNLSILYARSMLFAEALDALRRSAQLQEGIPDAGRYREFMTWTDQAELCLEMGDIPAAEAAARRGIEATSAEGPIFGRGEPHACLGAALLEQGRIDEAIDALNEAQRRFEKLGHRIGLAQIAHGLARASARRGDTARAREQITTAIALARACGARTDAAKFQCWLGRLALEAGDDAGALKLAQESLIDCTSTPGIVPAELEARRLIADSLAARGDSAAALAAHREYHARFAAAHDARKAMQTRVLAAQYQLDLAQRDAAHARLENAHLSEALAEIAARLEAEKSGKPARPAGETTPQSLRGLGLRPRECDVLHWVVRGKSNEEIGLILGCSAETVKSHLKRIYAQLDVTNRASATAKALSAASSAPVT